MAQLTDWEVLKRSAYWSDQFFNMDEIGIAGFVDPVWPNDEEVRQNATLFVSHFPGCPFGVEWLVMDFMKRW